jgi:alkylhydroperoxidase family enzyme
MARIDLLPQHPEEPVARALFDQVRAARGPEFQLPDLYRVLGAAPAMFKAWLDFAWPLRLHARTSRKLRELLILRGAQVSATNYEWAHHLPMAREAGASEEQIRSLADWRSAGCFDAQERAVLRVAEEITRGPDASEGAVQQLKDAGFDDADVVEFVLTASFYVCVSRFLKSMDVGLEAGYEQHLAAMTGAT